jgi:hypothetical protein
MICHRDLCDLDISILDKLNVELVQMFEPKVMKSLA